MLPPGGSSGYQDQAPFYKLLKLKLGKKFDFAKQVDKITIEIIGFIEENFAVVVLLLHSPAIV